MIDPRVAGGLRDLPPAQAVPRERLLRAFRDVFARFGYLPIETPHIERMEVLTGKGAGSDEVVRQIFEVTNKGGTPGELALRFDLTVPLARFIARHVDQLGVPFKRYAIGSVFRGERPAKGRFREFTQCDFDTVGTEGVVADAETVQVVHDALAAAGVPGFTIALNNRKVLDGLLDSIGVGDETYLNSGHVFTKEMKVSHILRTIDKRDKIGADGLREELLQRFQPTTFYDEGHTASVRILNVSRELGVESSGGQTFVTPEQAAKIVEFVQASTSGLEELGRLESDLSSSPRAVEGISNLRAVLDLLDAAGVPSDRLAIDLGLARGLDYYTGIVIETTIQGWERFGSVASGGRYDDLASLFTPRRLPGVGASIGLDRLLALMDEAGWLAGAGTTAPVLVAQFPGVDPGVPVRLASRLRAAGIGAEVFPDAIAIGKQMGYGSSRGHKVAVIVGPDEAGRHVFNLRDLATRQERKGIAWDDLEAAVGEALAGSR